MIIPVWRNYSLFSRAFNQVAKTSALSANYMCLTRPYFQVSQQLKANNSFAKFQIHQKSINILREKGINEFFPIQAQTFKHINQGKNVIGGDKTGSGKTIAFSLPIIQRLRNNDSFKKNQGIKFVVLAPTRQLAVQIGEQIKSLRHQKQQFQIVTVFGGVPTSLNEKRLRYHPDILIGTPGRVKDLMDRKLLNFTNVQVVCVDEADYMFDIGLQEDVDKIMETIKKSSKNQCQYLCFSATLNKKVTSFTDKYMKENRVIVKNNQKVISPETIEHLFVQTDIDIEKKIQIIRYLITYRQNDGGVLIFTNTKRQANSISESLSISNVVIHGDIQQKKRLQRLNLFKKGQVKVMIASDVAARGLDISNVQLVINYEFPNNAQSYIHRSGRTGRAGRAGRCVSLIDSTRELRQVQGLLNKKMKQIKINESQLQKVNSIVQQKYAELKEQPKKRDQKLESQQKSRFELILFDKYDNITKKNLIEKLQDMNVKFQYLKQIIQEQKGNKFFVLKCETPEDADKALEIQIKTQKSRRLFAFQRKIVKNFQK